MLVKTSADGKSFYGLGIICVILMIVLLLPGLAQAEMDNNLSNPGCVSCHTNYPLQHRVSNCGPCHGGWYPGTTPQPNWTAMWNCRYCHLTMVYDTYKGYYGYPDWTGSVSGFRSWLDPLHGAPLGSKKWWQAGHYGNGGPQYLPPNPPRVDADFNYHNNSTGFQHTSGFSNPGCIACHKGTLTAEHEEKTKLFKNPSEDFEDGAFTFNFTGIWGGEWSRASDAVYTGTYSFKSGIIGGSATYGTFPTATTQTTVDVFSTLTVSFWYRVTNPAYPLKFYIDDAQVLTGTSTVWTKVSYSMWRPGESATLKWATSANSAYIDDLSVSGAKTTYTMDCNTCHLSSDPSVTTAIANHDTGCSACHPGEHHENLHNGSLDSGCQQCHLPELTQEHYTNPKTTAGRNLDCTTCHSSTDTQVQRAISNGDLDCARCHNTAHKLSITVKEPADIPLYTGFIWTTPMEAALFAGESDFPTGYEQGFVVLSNRRTDVTCLQILDYYKSQLAATGWIVGPDPFPPFPPFLNWRMVQFNKQDRLLTLRVFNTENADGSGQQGLRYRVQLWYTNKASD